MPQIQDKTNSHKHPPWIKEAASVLVNTVLPAYEKGATFDPRTLGFPAFTKETFAVSLRRHQQKFDHVPTVDEVTRWAAKRGRHVILCAEGKYVGYWPDDKGKARYLDISELIHSRDSAVKLAQRRFQKAIYHPLTNKSIRVKSMWRVFKIRFRFSVVRATKRLIRGQGHWWSRA